MNVLTISGNLGRDAEVRSTNSGTSLLSFSVPVKSGFGEREQTIWVDCTLWGKRAEGGLSQHMTKGTPVVVSGEFSTEEYEGKTKVKLNVNEVTLMGKGQERQESAPAQVTTPEPHQGLDDEIPFN